MSLREIHALIYSPSSSSSSNTVTFNKQLVYIEGWKRACLVGVSSYTLPECFCHSIQKSSAKDQAAITASSGSSLDPVDGALFSAQQSWRPSLHTLRKQIKQSLEGFGIGAAGLAQGTLGLLLVAGTLGLGSRILWQKASQIASLPQKYEAILEFPFASGITIGTLVRIRGVDVGTVINVRPCLERIDARVQVTDSSVYIPRNALIEVNQSGLVGETIIDITPMNPVPRPSVGPLDSSCSSEGLIVCNKERIKGQQGVSMDDLMRLCGKMCKSTKDPDLKDMFKTADQMGSAVDNSKLILQKVERLVEDFEPVVKELQDGRLLKDLTELLKLTTETVHRLRASSFTAENKRAVLDLVANLTTWLKILESSSEDVGVILKNENNQRNTKHLVELLSRLVDDRA